MTRTLAVVIVFLLPMAGFASGDEVLVTWAEVCIVVHIGTVIRESLRTRVNLSRAMITGARDMRDTTRIVP